LLVAAAFGACIWMLPFVFLWHTGYFDKCPADEWPDSWKRASPLPEVLLATREYVSKHGETPKRKEDLHGIVVPSVGHTSSGEPIIAATINEQTWKHVTYLQEVVAVHDHVEPVALPVAWRRDLANDTILVIYLDGHIEETELDALRTRIEKLQSH